VSLPRMSFHIGDYKKDTGHLSTEQHGAYLLLIMHYWTTGGLPDDDEQLARITGLTLREWRKHRSTIAALFKDGPWRHKRIDRELAEADEKYQRRAAAGSRGGKAKSSNARAMPEQCSSNQQCSSNREPISKKERTDANASDADASRDVRTDLFREGLATLAKITGKTPDSCRSLVGKWLKSVNDEAIHVLGAIQDAERNRVADPVAWIGRRLTPKGNGHADDRSLGAVARAAAERARTLAEEHELRNRDGFTSDRLLPERSRP
jgi:uncharacterized protein YdaU (DUF1376 family)